MKIPFRVKYAEFVNEDTLQIWSGDYNAPKSKAAYLKLPKWLLAVIDKENEQFAKQKIQALRNELKSIMGIE